MQNKKAAFPEADVQLAEAAKALGHPARIAILRVLAERNTCICGEIVEVLPLAQATVSQHLKALKKAGLVQGTVDGPRSYNGLDPGRLSKHTSALGDLFTTLKKSCC